MTTELHSFVVSKVDMSLCVHCNRPFTEHSTCESCNNKASHLALFGKLLLCKSCLDREYSLAVDQTQERINNYESAIEMQKIDYSVQVVTDYFNSETIPLTEIRNAVYSDLTLNDDQKRYKYAELVDARKKHFQSVLIERKRETLELENKIRVDQQELNRLAAQLHIEERIKLGLPAIEYPEQKIPKSAPKIAKRMTMEDKAIANYMQLMNIDERSARELVRNQFRAMNLKCTCSEAPGTCKLHSS